MNLIRVLRDLTPSQRFTPTRAVPPSWANLKALAFFLAAVSVMACQTRANLRAAGHGVTVARDSDRAEPEPARLGRAGRARRWPGRWARLADSG